MIIEMEIPNDVKQNLRAVLGASPGMKQSNVLKEYCQLTNERLEYTKYGFKNLYEFLLTLEGEVSRLEFSPKDEDNLVYCVLDDSKYVSKHAKKYASKVKTGMKSKSPLEIIDWKKRNSNVNVNALIPPTVHRNTRKKSGRTRGGSGLGNGSRTRSSRPPAIISSSTSTETNPRKNEWELLPKLSPDRDGGFRLKIQNIGVYQERNIFLEEQAFYSHFDVNNVIRNSFCILNKSDNNKRYITLSFPSYFTAFCAWKEKDMSIVLGSQISVEPISSNINIFKPYIVSVTNIPNNITITSLVTLFAKFNGLVLIDPKLSEQYALISYSLIESAQKVCREVTFIHAGGQKHSITVCMLDDNKTNEKPKDGNHASDQCTITTDEASPIISINRVCGFQISYQIFYEMFKVTCKKAPKPIASLPSDIHFIVTHHVDPVRFWGWMINDDTVKKLSEVEEKLSTTVVNIQPPHVLPKKGQRGASYYTEDCGKKSWYRCYILSSNEEEDQLEVFYCDYGNSEKVQRDQFRSTYNDIWVLPPQAVPFKVYGHDISQNLCKDECFFAFEDLTVYTAKVMKESDYSEEHIVEIKDIRNLQGNMEILDDKIISLLPKGNSDEKFTTDMEETDDETEDGLLTIGSESPETKSSLVTMDSIFDYDENDLVIGLLVTVHNPSLLYLKLCDEFQFLVIQDNLEKHALVSPNKVEKGYNFLLCKDGTRNRVLVLQMLSSFPKVKVLYVDFGTIEWVLISDLYMLSDELSNVPFQARPAELAGISTFDMDKAIEYLKTQSKTIVKANIIEELSSGKISVELFLSKGGKSINKHLVELGAANLLHLNESSIKDLHKEQIVKTNENETFINNKMTKIQEEKGESDQKNPTMKNTSEEQIVKVSENEACINILETKVLDKKSKIYQQDPTVKNMCEDEIVREDENETLTNMVKAKIEDEKSEIYPKDPTVQNISEDGIVKEDENETLTNMVKAKIEDEKSEIYQQDPKVKDISEDKIVKEDENETLSNMVKAKIEDEKNETNQKDQIEKLIQREDSASLISWKSNQKNPFELEEKENVLPMDNIPKLMEVKTWLDKSPVKRTACSDDLHDHSNHVPPLLNDHESSICSSMPDKCMDRNYLTSDKSSVCSLSRVGSNSDVLKKSEQDLKDKWTLEKSTLLEIHSKVQHLLTLPSNELMSYYRERKKEKLQQKCRLKSKKIELAQLTNEYNKIVEETSNILSLV